MNSRIFKNFITTGVPFGLSMGLFFLWKYGSSFAIFGGVGCGLFFGIFMAVFAETKRKKMQSSDNSLEGEEVLLQGPANHFLKKEGRGGWLYLTQNKLAFRSHGKNIQNAPLDIFLKDIESASLSTTLGIIPNGLRVITLAGEKESFVLSNRKHWLELIEKAKAE